MNGDVVIGDDQIEITRFFGYPREAVFAAWADPRQLEQWWGCHDSDRVEATIDFRVGGAIRYVMYMKSGSEVVTEGTYVEIDVPSRIVTESHMGAGSPFEFTSTTTVEFIESGGGTTVRLTQVGLPPMPEPGPIIAGGFGASLEALDVHLSGQSAA